jgi:hypothetical protein
MSGEHDTHREGDRPHGDAEQTLSVLRGIWSANGQTEDELEERFGTGTAKVCKNMANIGFGGMGKGARQAAGGTTNTPVDHDVRAAWRAQLEREGKIPPQAESVGESLRRADR